MRWCRAIAIAGAVGISIPAFSVTSTELPPSGRRAAALIFVQTPTIDSLFNSSGHLEFLASPLNRSISIDQVIAATKDPEVKELARLKDALNTLGPNRLGDNLFIANLSGEVHAQEQRFIPAFLWSFSDNFAVGALMNVIKRKTTVSFSADVTNNAAKMAETVGDVGAIREGLQKLAKATINTQTFEDALFVDNGYKRPASFQAYGIGDTEIESRYTYYKNSWTNMQFRSRLKIPTSNYTVDVTNYFDRPLGGDAFGIRAGLYEDFKIIPGWITFTSAVAVTGYLPARIKKAVPKDNTELIPDINRHPEQIETLDHETGADLDVDNGLMFDFFSGVISLSGSYVYSVHAKDSYRGNRGFDYARLSDTTNTSTHGVELGFQFSTVPMFFAKTFPLPARLIFSWFQPFAGYNTVFAPYGSVNAILLF